jgi:O-antigen/teichoic acid export membrane protein
MDASRVARNTGFLYVRIFINIFISLYSTRIVLDALGVEDFGIYNLVAGVIGMLAFLNSAMAEASQRFMAFAHGEQDIEKQKRIFNVSIILHLLIAVAVFLILEIAGYYLFKGVLEIPAERVKTAKIVYQFMLVSTLFSIIRVPYDAVLNAHENMFVVALIGITNSVIKLGIALYVAYTSFDKLIMYGLLMALLAVAMIAALYFYCHFKYKEVKFGLRVYFDKLLFREMGGFAGWTFLGQAAYVITMQGTTVVLNSFFGVIVNAAQGIANQVSNQLKEFSVTMQQALNPVIVKREGKKDRHKMLEAAMFGNKISFFVLSFLSIPLLIEMPNVLNIWLKDVPEFAVIFCRLQLLRIIVGSLTQSFYVALGAIGKIKNYTIWESSIFVMVLPISYLMFKLGAPPEMIYINLVFLGIAVQIVRIFFLKRLGGLSIRMFLKNVVLRSSLVFVIAFSIASVPLFLFADNLLRVLLVIVASSVPFLAATYFVGFNNIERKQVFDIIYRFGSRGFLRKN